MKLTNLCIFFLAIATACGSPAKEESQDQTPVATSAESPVETLDYPQQLTQIFEAHGGMSAWSAMRSLYFEIPGDKGSEKHYIALDSRHDRVENDEATMGFDGENVWIVADTSYQRDPVFYHNLMFYFYAMPFVLGDPGIVYEDTEDLVFEGTSYPGIAVSYEDGVGTSSKDEYFIHFDPQSSQMAWLGYTVTYFSGEKSEKISWIRYQDWQTVQGLVLPKAISWYQHENGAPTELRNTVEFESVTLNTEPHQADLFSAPADAQIK